MTAGRGVIHSELPSPEFLRSGGILHGFQLWVNLPASHKMVAARYQGMTAEQIPSAEGEGYTLRLIGGELLGLRSPVETAIPITYAHLSLRPNHGFDLPLPVSQEAHLFPFSGDIRVNGAALEEGCFGSLKALEAVHVSTENDGCECLLLAAKPLHEPMVRYGPFVMNTRHQLIQAIEDYQQGKLTTPMES